MDFIGEKGSSHEYQYRNIMHIFLGTKSGDANRIDLNDIYQL